MFVCAFELWETENWIRKWMARWAAYKFPSLRKHWTLHSAPSSNTFYAQHYANLFIWILDLIRNRSSQHVSMVERVIWNSECFEETKSWSRRSKWNDRVSHNHDSLNGAICVICAQIIVEPTSYFLSFNSRADHLLEMQISSDKWRHEADERHRTRKREIMDLLTRFQQQDTLHCLLISFFTKFANPLN